MNRRERLRRINRSAVWTLTLSVVFGLVLPIFVLERDSAPPYTFIRDLGGVQLTEAFSKPGKVPITKTVTYSFDVPAVIVIESAKKELKEPGWTFFAKYFLFQHTNGDSGMVTPRHDECTLSVTYQQTGFEDLWMRFKTSIGL